MNRKDFLQSLGIISFAATGIEKTLPVYGPVCKTSKDAEGPFYRKNAPVRNTISTDGEALKIEGVILTGADCNKPVPKATIDIWHCDHSGKYDMEGFICRGQVISGPDGRYSFSTIFPPAYGNRPRHIHFKIRAEGLPELTTQLYFEGDPYIKNDFAKNAEKNRVIKLGDAGGIKTGIFNIFI